MNPALEALFDRARSNPQRIAFPEAHDDTMLEAAHIVATEGLGIPVLVGGAEALAARCTERGYDPMAFEFADVADEAHTNALVAEYSLDPTALLWDDILKFKMVGDPLTYALVMQALGEVRAVAAGYVASTADVITAASTVIGIEPGTTMSSCAVVELPEHEGLPGDLLFLADVSTCPDPSAQELADIAIAACETARSLTGDAPRCAMLSYSTLGSAKGPKVDKVIEATRIVRERRPDLLVEGELQLDAAINPIVGAKKAGAENPVAGHANVLVFPDLNAGNIAVKVFTEYGGARLLGVCLNGFKKPCSDNSRGASVDELVGNIVLSAMRAVDHEEAMTHDA